MKYPKLSVGEIDWNELTLRRYVQEIIKNFNSEKCVLIMNLLGWKWVWVEGLMTPGVFELGLEKALWETIRNGSYVSGGFHFHLDKGEDEFGNWVRINGGFTISSVDTMDGVSYQEVK